MSSPYGKAIVIVNSRAGSSERDKSSLNSLITGTGIDFEIRSTERRGHAVELAKESIEQGYRYLVAVGGDGTIHEVVNGMMQAGASPDTVLGIIPAGSGSDFVKTFGLPAKAEDAVNHLSGEQYFAVDVGIVSYSQDGDEQKRYFVNIAEAGLGGEVVRRAEALPRRLGRVRYLLSFWMTLARYKSGQGKVLLDKRVYEGKVTNLVVANAQFFGGGMRIAPKAHPADGKFDVLIQRGTKRDYVAGITKVFKGEHLPSPAIKEYHARYVEVVCEPSLQVEADGEVLGFTPATFEIIPNAYRLKI
ncbi:MAG: diacylglycerol kinase family protein [Actinomycetota bacterium]